MKKTLCALFCSTCLLAPAAFAGAGHDHGPRHGGSVREVGNIGYELVAKADSLTLYVFDHGKPLATAGAKARVTLYSGSAKTEVTLEPAGENRLAAQGNFKVGVGVRAALAITLPGRSEAKATFNLK